MRAVVINLRRRPDRLTGFLTRWAAADTGDTPLDVFAAIDGGDTGCLQSHLNVLSSAAGPLLVLEDDACFTPSFTLPVDPPTDWEIAWLGGQHRLAPRPHNQGWVIPTRFVRTHAYLVQDPPRVAALLRRAPRIDPYLAQLPLRQYVQRVQTVGQAAGRSDIDGTIRHLDQYWHHRQVWKPVHR